MYTGPALRQLGVLAASRPWLGVAVVVSWVLVGPSAAWAQVDDTCSDTGIDHLEAPETSSGDRPESTPCEFDRYDSPAYNVCFAANPRPVSTMPIWIAGAEAEGLAGDVLARTYSLYRHASPEVDSPALSEPRPRFKALVDQFGDAPRPAGPARACFEGEYDERCHELPSPAVTVGAGSTPPVHLSSDDIELPPRIEDDDRSQRPLVRLRVGPSAGHDSPPDRPPPV